MTKQEAVVLKMVEDSMTRDPTDNSISVSYPWKECVHRLKNNSEQALKIQENIEKRRIKEGVKESFDEEIHKAFKAGTIRKLEEKEMEEWKGPVNYNTLFPVIKEECVH